MGLFLPSDDTCTYIHIYIYIYLHIHIQREETNTSRVVLPVHGVRH